MKKLIIPFALCMAISATTQADEALHTAIEKMFELTNTQKAFDDPFDPLTELGKNPFSFDHLSESEQKVYQEYENKIKELRQSEFGWNNYQKHLVKIYAEVYTKEEIDDINAFYESEAGQKMLAKEPLIQAKMGKLLNESFKEFQPKLDKLYEERDAALDRVRD